VKTIILISIFVVACFAVFADEAVAPADETSAKTSSNPELEQALATEKDSYGIPQGIYSMDFELDELKRTIESQQSSMAILGGVSIGLMVGGIIFALAAPQLVWAPFGAATTIQYGYFVTGLGAVFGLYAVIAIPPGIKKNKEALTSTFESKYPE
jgi:hypothetical protein